MHSAAEAVLLTPVDVLAILLALVSGVTLLNHHILKLPMTIGLVVGGLVTSLLLIGTDQAFGLGLAPAVRSHVAEFDFRSLMLDWMLPFLLFAGAIRISMSDLAQSRWSIGLVASVGVVLSAVLIGVGFSLITGLPLLVCLVFGALISPTDPVAVLGLLRVVKVPASLEIKIAGESMFNDGVGIVLFLVVTGLAFGSGSGGAAAEAGLHVSAVVSIFLREVLGGALLGLTLGFMVYRLLRTIDDFFVEAFLTVTLVLVTTAIASHLHASAPIAVVVAGLFIGNIAACRAIRAASWAHVEATWHMIDEALNAVLFLLIGLEVLAIRFDISLFLIGLAAVPLALAARFIAVAVPITLLRPWRTFEPGTVRIMTWGGLRGGVSIALALSLPPGPERDVILTATYVVVVFSIIVQGLSIRPLVGRIMP